jgi:transcriptional regulator with XRE-family HTH domain
METKINVQLIDKRCRQLGVNRTGLADEMGISKQLLSYYISNPTLKSIYKIADALGVRWRSLII